MTFRLARQISFQPLYAIAFVATLALAIAASATSAAAVKRALWDDLPYPDGDRLVSIQTRQLPDYRGAVSIFIFDDLRKSGQTVFQKLAPARWATPTYQGSDVAESVDAQEVTQEYFETLQSRPALGAVWAQSDPNAVIVSWAFWQRFLSADPNVVGRSIVLDGTSRHIVGVMPQHFMAPFGPDVDVWLPFDLRPLFADTARGRRTITVFGRLAPGVALQDANTYLAAFSSAQQTQYPAIHSKESWQASLLREEFIGPSSASLMGVGAAAALLTLIVWANIAGLAAVTATAQRHQFAIQTALGAAGRRLFLERLRDSLLLSFAASVIGLGLAKALTSLIARYQADFLPLISPIQFESASVALGLLLAAITGALAALAGHAAARGLSSEDVLRSSRAATADRRVSWLRSGLVAAQVAIAIVLVVGAGLLMQTVWNLSTTSIGFRTNNLTYLHVTLPQPSYRQTDRQIQFERDLRARIEAIPGVTGVSASVGFPTLGTMGARLWVLNRPDSNEQPPEIGYYSVSPKFFSFLSVPIIEGRDIEETDVFASPRVVVINQTMARMFWPDGHAIGAKVKIGAGAASDREITVVGIAADVRQNGPARAVRPVAYGSTLQYSWPRRHIAVKTEQPLAGLGAQLRDAVRAIDSSVATTEPKRLDANLEDMTARQSLVMLTLSFFGTVAITLCGLGLYATVALNSQARRREYAIRVALGSTRSRVCWLVVRHAMALAFGGAVMGLLAASTSTKVLGTLLHGVDPVDAPTFAVAFVGMLLLAVASAALPALSAGRVNPAETLRSE